MLSSSIEVARSGWPDLMLRTVLGQPISPQNFKQNVEWVWDAVGGWMDVQVE